MFNLEGKVHFYFHYLLMKPQDISNNSDFVINRNKKYFYIIELLQISGNIIYAHRCLKL